LSALAVAAGNDETPNEVAFDRATIIHGVLLRRMG
jgi:hypothetical protein